MNTSDKSGLSRDQWLADMKPGDKAAIPSRWSDGGRVVVVERVTPTLLVMQGGDRFRRKDGKALQGSDWHREWLQPITPGFLANYERAVLCRWLEEVTARRKTLPVETLRAMKAAYSEETKQEAA